MNCLLESSEHWFFVIYSKIVKPFCLRTFLIVRHIFKNYETHPFSSSRCMYVCLFNESPQIALKNRILYWIAFRGSIAYNNCIRILSYFCHGNVMAVNQG